MTLSDISIKKPVFAWMLMIGLLAFGGICFSRMGISLLPDVDFPVVNVSVSWTGASPETIELAVTDIVENAIMSVEGVRSVTSQCLEGVSNTTVEFELNRNIDVALQEVQTKISQAQKILPQDADPAIVTKQNPEDQPIVWAALSGGKTVREMVVFTRDHLKDSITTVGGVGDVRLGGYIDPNMRVWLNTNKMKNAQISVADVNSAITQGNSLTPTGYVDSGPKETNLKVVSEALTPDDFRNIIIPARGGAPIWSTIHLKDVARVEEGLADIRRISRVNGDPAIGLGVVKQRGSNAVAVGKGVKDHMAALAGVLPAGMKLRPVVDSTKFIEDSTAELLMTLTLSALLTAIVCWLFLGTLGSAFNVVIAIPVSLIGTFIALKAAGFTINTFTLLALSLSIGIVVDDAIMVLENIVRHYEAGMSRVKAALVGAREITGAATASSIAILAIFLPVVFMNGIVGKFFFQFGIAMSVAVILSLLEALTLAPMRCSQFLTHTHDNYVSRHMNRFMDKFVAYYQGMLGRALARPWKILIVAFVIFFGSLFLLPGLKKEFVPPQDQSRFLVSVTTPMGSSLEFTDGVFKKLEKLLLDRPEVNVIFVAVGGFQGGLVNQGNIFVTLKDPSERKIEAPFTHRPSQQEFMGWAREAFNKVEGVKTASMIDLSLSGFSSSRGFPIQFQVQGPDWEKLASVSLEFVKKLKDSGLVTDVDTDYNPNMPEARVIPNREKAYQRGVTVGNIADTISAMVGSLRVGRYTDSSGHRDDVRVKLEDEFNHSPNDITRIWVRNNRGEMVALSDVVTVENKSSLLTISRFNRERSISIFGNLVTGKSQTDVMNYIDQTAKELLPPNYHTVLSGSSQVFKETFMEFFLVLALGILVAYMVLGTQFNSFIQPAVVLLALPFSLTGALIALKVTNISLNMYSFIGVLLLMGIVKKNSILLVDFTNHKRLEGLAIREALIEACPLRLRPIVMTSVATIAAAVPIALSLGSGAETTRPMAIVVIGGVTVSTLLTLIVVPCAYLLMAKLERPKHQQELDQALKDLGELKPAVKY